MTDINTSENVTFDAETGEVVEETSAELALAADGVAMLHAFGNTTTAEISAFGFDAASPDGIKRIFNAQEDGESLSEAGVTELTLAGILLRPGVRVDPVSGSRTACVNTILMSADGHNYVTQSNGIARTAARIIGLYANGWPEEGVAVALKEQKLDRGRTYKKLVLA